MIYLGLKKVHGDEKFLKLGFRDEKFVYKNWG